MRLAATINGEVATLRVVCDCCGLPTVRASKAETLAIVIGRFGARHPLCFGCRRALDTNFRDDGTQRDDTRTGHHAP